MACAWNGTIAELKMLVDSGRHVTEIARGFESVYQTATDPELFSWQISIPAFIQVVSDPKFDHLQAIVELAMPIGAERADLVLLGGTPKEPRAVVIELKQWSHIALLPESLEIEVPGIGIHQHPSIQALNYTGKLHFFNARAHKYQIQAMAFLHNATSQDIDQISQGPAREWITKAPLFIETDRATLESFLADSLLPVDLDAGESQLFSDAPYDQSHQLFDFLRSHARDIAKGAALAIANQGMGLTTEQDRLKNEILLSALNRQSIDYIVQGGPGSGKTLLAVSLLLKAAENNLSCILALRNNRLQAILRQIFDSSYPGASGMMMYFEPRQGRGIAQFNGHVDLLICDEAQRMERRIMPNVLRKGNVTAIFLDETQRLNPPEQGTLQNFSDSSLEVKRKPIIRFLTASVRVPLSYSNWVERLLSSPQLPSVLQLDRQPWRASYNLEICSTIQDLISRLGELHTPGARVAMVASFTESPGKSSPVYHSDNIRIGYPLTSGFDLYKDSDITIPWLMSTSHYKSFWIKGTSNQLDRVASIYGAQGFESDYVGIIWGRDLIYRNDKWQLGDANVSYDAIDRLITGRRGNRHWSPEAIGLLINRYRIFLTRGIKGTLIFCEDAPTHDYLLSLSSSK